MPVLGVQTSIDGTEKPIVAPTQPAEKLFEPVKVMTGQQTLNLDQP